MADDEVEGATTEASGQSATERFDAPRADHEIYDAFGEQQQAYGMNPTDGMPRPVVESTVDLAAAPPLDPETLVCMEDDSEYVLRDLFWKRVIARFTRAEVVITDNGVARVPLKLVFERLSEDTLLHQAYLALRAADEADKRGPAELLIQLLCGPEMDQTDAHRLIFEAMRQSVRKGNGMGYIITNEWAAVEALRPACEHYARQFTDFQDDPDHQMMIRLCTARRDASGEFLSVRDAKMIACELRTPRCPKSEQQLRAFDAKLIDAARLAKKQKEDKFDPMAALKNEGMQSE